MDIKESRQLLVDTLKAINIYVYEANPELFQAPCAIVWLGTPFLFTDENCTFVDTAIGWEIDLIVDKGTNETETDEMLSMIGSVYTHLKAQGFRLGEVGQPVMTQKNNARYMTTTVAITGYVQI